MSLKNILPCFIISFLFLNNVKAQSIIINEVSSLNFSVIQDEDGDFEDWIEIYNNGNQAVNLHHYHITDDPSTPNKWAFPEYNLLPDTYLLVWASGKNRDSEHFHTNFSLKSGGEHLMLRNHLGQLVDEVMLPELPADVSFGRETSNIRTFRFFETPTPGAPNNTQAYHELLPMPELSHDCGFYNSQFYLKVSHPDPQVVIRYTLNGSVPDANSEVFPDSLLIINRSEQPDLISSVPTTPLSVSTYYRWYPPIGLVSKGTNIRLKAFKDNALSPSVKTADFWVYPQGADRYSFPVVSLSMPQSSLLGPNGIYTYYIGTGMDWEREAHFAFFDSDGTLSFSTDAGLRLHGGNSRRYALKSFRVYFREAYGESAMEYPVFQDQETYPHERLVLRNGGSDWAYSYFRDAFAQAITKDISTVDRQGFQPAVVFINGEYWGIMNIRERFDDNYIKNKYGFEDIDMLEMAGSTVYGDMVHYNALLNFLKNHNLNEDNNYEYVKSQMDVENFADYHILQIFSMNTDQPGKNARFWRPRIEGGKWQWLLFDMDDSFNFGSHNTFDRNGLVYCSGLNNINSTIVNGYTAPPSWAPNGPSQTFPLRALLKSHEFRTAFINRFADLLNTVFTPDYLNQLLDVFVELYEGEMPEHFNRWHRPQPDIWQEHIEKIRHFSNLRPQTMKEHIISFFNLDGTFNLSTSVGSGEGYLKVNTLDILSSTPGIGNVDDAWTGTYFQNLPLSIKAIARPGYKFSHWSGDRFSSDPEILINTDSDFSITANFIPDNDPMTEKTLVYYWHFNELDTSTGDVTQINADYSLFSNRTPKMIYTGEGLRHMDHYNTGSDINLHLSHTPGKAVRVRNNSEGRHLLFNLNTENVSDVNFSYAVHRSAQGMLFNIISYSVDGTNFSQLGMNQSIFSVTEDYQLIHLDFSNIPAVNNNPNFHIRIDFHGNTNQDNGNNRFDNISLSGNVTPVSITDNHPRSSLHVFPNPTQNHLQITSDSELEMIRIFDLSGRLLQQWPGCGLLSCSISIGHFSPGIYLIQSQTSSGSKMNRIIKS